MAKIADAYAEAYEGSGMNADEIWEEIICDSLGDMNVFAPVELLGEMNSDFLTELKKEVKKDAKSERGPPASAKEEKVLGKSSREFNAHYSYKALTKKDDLSVITLSETVPMTQSGKIDKNAIVEQARLNTRKQKKPNNTETSTYVRVDDIGLDVLIGVKGLQHGLVRSEETALAVMKIGDVLKNSFAVNELNGSVARKTDMSYVLLGACQDGKNLYAVRSVVSKLQNDVTEIDVYQLSAVKGKKTETPNSALKRGAAVTEQSSLISSGSLTVSIADFLQYVKDIPMINEIFSEDVAKKLGVNRYQGTLSNDIRFSRELDVEAMEATSASKPKLSNRAILANALESVVQKPEELEQLRKYKARVAEAEELEAHLAKVNRQINEITFTKGADRSLLPALKEDKIKTENNLKTYDGILLRLEATKNLKSLLEREKKLAYQKAAKEGRETLNSYRNQRNKTEMRHNIIKVGNELNQYLLNGTKDKHVPIELQRPVAEALDAVNMDTVGADPRVAHYNELIARTNDPEVIAELEATRDRIQRQGENLALKLAALKASYAEIINSPDPIIANAYDENISNTIGSVIKDIGDTPLRDMSLYQLKKVYNMFRMVLESVRNANKAFKMNKAEEISTIAEMLMREIAATGKRMLYLNKTMSALSRLEWNNLKTGYFFERLGSSTLLELYRNIRAAEDVWGTDMAEAEDFRISTQKKYHYDAWDHKETYSFTAANGREFSLNIGQIMSLYAHMRRGDQSVQHLRIGGFVFDAYTTVKKEITKTKSGKSISYEVMLNDASNYTLSDTLLAEIISHLSADQKAFVNEMQAYLSDVMGAKGNEVSRILYGIDLFGEEYYFPLQSSELYLKKVGEIINGTVKLKNRGFTKETKPNANNPITLSSFMDVWATHVNEMSEYHALTLPMEDFYRVYNYGRRDADVDLSEDNELSKRVDGVYGAKRYKIIADYIYSSLGNGEIELSDGKKAIVDKRDALHIANKAGHKKTMQIAKIKDLIAQASLCAEDTHAVHDKFTAFSYYEVTVRYKSEVYSLYLNVGKGINDNKYHIYDITTKIRDTAGRVYGLERPKPNEGYALLNDISNKSISQNGEVVNTQNAL